MEFANNICFNVFENMIISRNILWLCFVDIFLLEQLIVPIKLHSQIKN